MNTFVALLRGINVGGNNKIEMVKLKTCFETLGYINVVTYINSGNVIFETRKSDSKKLVSKIEDAIKESFKLDIPVVLRDQKNIEKICKKVPTDWTNDKDHKTDVLFLWDEYVKPNTRKQIATNPKVDTLLYIDGALVWHLKKKDYNKSKMNDIIGTDVYKNMTARNINTVRKLLELMNQ